ncbi:WD40 repeat-like protein [Peniophora sp. CONT]|nr:WD40 repeat-like protein [Peniophora sp. CONT]
MPCGRIPPCSDPRSPFTSKRGDTQSPHPWQEARALSRRDLSAMTNFGDIWSNALDEYRHLTGVDLRDSQNMSIVRQLEQCSDSDDILDRLDTASKGFNRWRKGGRWSRRLRSVLKPLVHGLNTIIEALAETASSAAHAPGGKGIFAALVVLMKAADSVSTTFDDIEKLFGRFKAYVVCLEKRVRVPIDHEMKVLAVRALVEMLKAMGHVTEILSKGRTGNFIGSLFNQSNVIADAIRELEEIERDESRLDVADIRVIVYNLKRTFEENIEGGGIMGRDVGSTPQVMPIKKRTDNRQVVANPLNAIFDWIDPLYYHADNSKPPSIFSELDLRVISGPTWFGALNPNAKETLGVEHLGAKRGSRVWQACFSVGGAYLAVNYLDVVKIYAVRTGQNVYEIVDPIIDEHAERGVILAMSVTSDARYLATGGRDGKIRIWSTTARDRDVRAELARHRQPVTGGRLDSVRSVVDVQDPLTRGLAGGEELSVAISPDGRLVAAGSLADPIVRIWDASSGTLVQRLRGHMRGIMSLAFTPDSVGLVTGSTDQLVMYWDLGSKLPPKAPVERHASTRTFVGHKESVTCVAVSRDGKWIISGGWDGTVRFWDLETTVLHLLLRGHTKSMKSVNFGFDSMFVTGSIDGQVGIWNYTCGIRIA